MASEHATGLIRATLTLAQDETSAVKPVAEMISAQSAHYGGKLSALYESVHGSDDPAVIEHQLDDFVRRTFGAGIGRGLFHVASVGSVTGVVLEDGRSVVIKAYQPRWSRHFLAAVLECQTALADAGLPCARPLSGPQPFVHGWATTESLLVDPGQPEEFGAAEMRASARGLAAVVALVTARSSPGLQDNPLQQRYEGLYPTPHSPLYDFVATASGAEWIDELATIAKPHLHIGPPVVAHTDWAARNVRLSAAGVRAIYDLDSLAVVPLPMALGQAAVTWRSTAEPGDGAAPCAEEVEAWLREYPRQLDEVEERAVFAHALWLLAYSSRCEHAVDPEGTLHRRARPTLRDQAGQFLRRMSASS